MKTSKDKKSVAAKAAPRYVRNEIRVEYMPFGRREFFFDTVVYTVFENTKNAIKVHTNV